MLTRLAIPVAAALLSLTLAACGSDEPAAEEPDGASTSAPSESGDSEASAEGASCEYLAGGAPAREVDTPPDTAQYSGEVEATVQLGQGEIGLTLDADNAPCTVNSFASLVEQDYFDDTICHRLTTTPGLSVLQCGDPLGEGFGGPGYSFADELSGQETYPAGTLAMANAGPDTNGSQFFLVYADSQLPPLYTVFGTISEDGLAIIEEIAAEGSDDANGPGDGAPNEEANIEEVTLD